MSHRKHVLAGLVALAGAFTSAPAFAQNAPDNVHAKEAYDRGVAAHAKGDYARAAREFAAADAFAPSPVALQAALEEAIDANDPITGAELLDRSKRITPPVPPKLAQSIELAKKKLGGRAGRIRVACPGGSTCTSTIDGRVFDPRAPLWVLSGWHTIVLQVDGDTETRPIGLRPDETIDIAIARKTPGPPPPVGTFPEQHEPDVVAPPPEHPRTHAHERSGAPPVVFFIGLGATLLAGGATTYYALLTRAKHNDFQNAGCATAPNAGCSDLGDDGTSAQRNANISIAVTAVLGVATIIIGTALTDWGGSSGELTSQGYVLRF